MRDLSSYFTPVNPESMPAEKLQVLIQLEQLHCDSFPALDGAKIALFGYGNDECDLFRKEWYKLIHNFNFRIIDLGNLIQGASIGDTQFALNEIYAELTDAGILPVCMAGKKDLIYPIYKTFENTGNYIAVTQISSRIDLWDDKGESTPLQQIFTHQPNFLFNYSSLGYQSYFTETATLAALQKMYFDAIRLGWANQHLDETEPVMRSTGFLWMDLDAIRLSDAPGQSNGSPNGFFGHEICRIIRYAGMNPAIQSFNITGFLPANDINRQTAMLLAQCFWYFCDGYSARYKEHPDENPGGFLKYTTGLKDNDEMIVFYKSPISEKWWMEIPNPNHKASVSGPITVPCSYSDYLTASGGDIPERWWNAFKRLN